MITQRGWTFNPDKPIWDKEIKVGKGEPRAERLVMAYLWSRTILCPSCTALIPLSPNWRLSPKLGLMMVPTPEYKVVQFKVVTAAKTSRGTIAKGIASCPLCGYVCKKFYPREEAQADRMGHIQTCYVTRDYWPIYRRKGGAIQGKSQKMYTVPPDVLFCSDRERWRCLGLLGGGWAAEAMKTDPIYRDLGLFGDPPPEYAVGMSAATRAAELLEDVTESC